jgi:hypothetical protein
MLIDLDLTDDQLWALAQFLKRAGFSDYLGLAVDKDEARILLDAGEKLRAVLAELGYAPR